MSFFERHVRSHFDQEFFALLPEVIDDACAEARASVSVDGRFKPYHLPYVEGTNRHYAIQSALGRLSVRLGAEEVVLRARNYPFALAKHRRFLIAAIVADNFRNLSRSKARRLMAEMNGVLEPYQPDLFDPEEPQRDAPLFAMIIVAKPRGGVLPSGVYFGVPTATLRGWHFYAEISEVFSMFNRVDHAVEKSVAVTKPRLRKFPRVRSTRKKSG